MMADNEIESQRNKEKKLIYWTAQHNLFLMIDGKIILFD